MKYALFYSFCLAVGMLLAFSSPLAKRKLLADKSLSTVTYSAKHPLHNWDGVSHEVNCAVIYNDDSKQPETIVVSLKVASFDSDNNNRDSHALEALESIRYPNVTFVSSDIKAGENGALMAKGTLTFHGVAKSITLQAVRKDAGGKMTITGEFPVSMTEYNIERPSLMGLKTEDALLLRFNVVFPL